MSANPTKMRGSQRRRRIVAVTSAVAISIGAAAFSANTASAGRNGNPQPPGNPDPKGQLIDLQLLGINDYHGHLEAKHARAPSPAHQPVAPSTCPPSSTSCVRATSTA